MSDNLKPCPCGQTPTGLGIVDNGQGGKWAAICTDCCGEWSIEFRTDYKPLDSPECMALAIEAWNRAPRGPCHEPQGLVFRSAEEVFKHYGVTLTDDGHEPFDPDPTPTGGKTGHDQHEGGL